MHQTPHLCEFRLAVEFSLAINFIIAPVNSSVARFRISLSSGISMFARGSLTRGIQLKSVLERTKSSDPSAALMELLPAMGNTSQLFQSLGAANGAMDPAMLMQLLNRMGKGN